MKKINFKKLLESGVIDSMAWTAFLLVMLMLAAGCANRGCKVTVSSASVTSLADINWEEYKWPIFAIWTGPRLTVWVNKDYLALSKIKGTGSVTNDTSALGIYCDKAGKEASVEMEFKPVTNLVTEVEAETAKFETQPAINRPRNQQTKNEFEKYCEELEKRNPYGARLVLD